MSDDLREREPTRDQGDNPPNDGTRSDIGATDGAAPGHQPGGGGLQDPANNVEPLRGQGTGSGGGYGSGSGESSAGSQDRVDGSGSDVGTQTEWLRDAPGQPASGQDQRDPA